MWLAFFISIIPWRYIQCFWLSIVYSYLLLNNVPCYAHTTVKPFTHWRKSGLIPVWGCYKCGFYEYYCKGFYVNINFHSFGKNDQGIIAGLYGSCIFTFIRNCWTVLQSSIFIPNKWVIQFLFTLTSICYYHYFYFSYFYRCVVIAQCGFNL